jgi:hypothetical protein
MGRNAIDYKTAELFIYKIIHKTRTDIDFNYVGNTHNINKRKSRHKSSCNNEWDKAYNLKIYQIIRSNGGWENWDMIIIHRCFVKDKIDAVMIEQSFMNEMKANMNSNKSYLTDEEKENYYENSKEERKQKYIENKEKYIEYQKEYSEKNKEKIVEKQRLYRLNNKEKLNEKYNCECGGKYTFTHKLRHEQTLKHKKYCLSIDE